MAQPQGLSGMGRRSVNSLLPRFLAGGGDAAREIVNFDWASSPLGEIDTWPDVLKTTVALMLRSGFPKALVWGQHLITFHNDAFRTILGHKPPAIGRPFSHVWSEAWSDIAPIAEKAMAGEATFIRDFPLMINRNGREETAYFTFSYSPVTDANGQIVGFMDTVVETTQSVVEKQRSDVLNAELAHRIKNVLALVTSIVSQTLKSSSNLQAAEDAIGLRIRALAAVQDVLRVGASTNADIHGIVSSAVSPHGLEAGRLTANGPNVSLDDTKALALSLALNELLTNAVKHGAFSNDVGTVSISWDVGSQGEFSLKWQERGGPAVLTPTKAGFGSRLIQRHVAGSFGGVAQITFEPSGIIYEIKPN
jgi:two-component sensor histidine kinase